MLTPKGSDVPWTPQRALDGDAQREQSLQRSSARGSGDPAAPRSRGLERGSASTSKQVALFWALSCSWGFGAHNIGEAVEVIHRFEAYYYYRTPTGLLQE